VVHIKKNWTSSTIIHWSGKHVSCLYVPSLICQVREGEDTAESRKKSAISQLQRTWDDLLAAKERADEVSQAERPGY
jgi:hypothetical protein